VREDRDAAAGCEGVTALTAIVPYRVDPAGLRRRNAEVVLHWLAAAGVGIVLAEHADAPDALLHLPDSAIRVHVPAHGRPFKKALACNAGFAATSTEVIALVDADTLMPTEAFLACASAVHATHDVIRPYGRLVELDEDATITLALGGPMPADAAGGHDDARGGEHIPLCGGIVILRRTAYASVGGMDETFEGWGGEDDALSVALIRSGLTTAINTSTPAFHLAHSRSLEERYGHAHYAENLAKARWWHEASDADLAAAMTQGQVRLRSHSR
jgi:hypothetical protein